MFYYNPAWCWSNPNVTVKNQYLSRRKIAGCNLSRNEVFNFPGDGP
jgi:hypothetical protein